MPDVRRADPVPVSPPVQNTLQMLWTNFGSIAILLTFVASMGGTYATVTALGAQVSKLDVTMTTGADKINLTLQDYGRTADKVRGLELAFERLSTQINVNNDKLNARLDKAVEDGRARNGAQDSVMYELGSNRKLDRADIDRLVNDVNKIADGANRPLPAARGVRN